MHCLGPYFFVSCSLVGSGEGTTPSSVGASLTGTLVSSLHRLKDTDNNDGAFFVFGDLSVKIEGRYHLQFSLHEIRNDHAFFLRSIWSDSFIVHSTKTFPGMKESTFLTRTFSDQGVRLRLRKEPRSLLKKRGPASDDYIPRHYNKGGGRSHHEEQPIIGEGASQTHGELHSSLYHPSQTTSFDHRSQVTRGYSYPSSESFSPTFAEEPNIKRSRTGSDHTQIQSLGPPQPLADTAQFSSPKLITDLPQHQGYGSYNQSPSQQSFATTYNYAQSPQSLTDARNTYFNSRLQSAQQGNTPYSSNVDERSSQSFYSPSQSNFPQYGMPQIGLPTPAMLSRVVPTGTFGTSERTQFLPSMETPNAVYGRMQTSSYLPPSSSIDMYQSQGAGYPTGMNLMPSTSNTPITSSGGASTAPY